jgi:RTX calcium-binding nonapeptide repeat (4 copies)
MLNTHQLRGLASPNRTLLQAIGVALPSPGSQPALLNSPPANNPPTGTVVISGEALETATLTASHTLEDPDGLPIDGITYHWLANGVAIPGATGSSYLLTQADVGATITVTASYIDNLGNPEAVTSEPTAAVANSNDSPTGSVAISGAPLRGQLLSASHTIADVDGIPADGIVYQWFSNDTAISGATGNTYLLTYADAGNSIRVVASYVDNYGTSEQVISDPTERVRLADLIDNVLPAYRVPSLGLNGDEDIDILDATLDIARLLDLANGYTTGLLNAGAALSVIGSAADLIQAYTAYNTTQIQGLGDEIIVLRDTTLDASILNELTSFSSNVVNAASVTNLTGLAADMSQAYAAWQAGQISGLGNEAIFLSNRILDAADLNSLNAMSTGLINAGSVLSIRGSAEELAASFAAEVARQVAGLAGKSVVLTNSSLEVVKLNALNAATLGIINAASLTSLSGLVADVSRAYTAGVAGEIRGLGNESITLTDSVLLAAGVSALLSIDSRTTGAIDVSQTTAISGTLDGLNSLYKSAGIVGLANQTLTLTNSIASVLAVTALNASTLQRAANKQSYRISYTGSSGNDAFSGFGLADVLSGGDGKDQLSGDSGADSLIGGNGADSLSGGDGADSFRYTALGQSLLNDPANGLLAGHDQITDFQIGIDSLDGPVAVTAVNLRELGSVSGLDATAIAAVLTTTTFLANRAASFTVGADAATRTFVALNNTQNGYQANLDAIIEITGYSGNLTDLAIV